MASEAVATVIVTIVKAWTYFYSLFTWIPYRIYFQVRSKRLEARRTKSILCGETGGYRYSATKPLTNTLFGDVSTLSGLFRRAVLHFGSREALGTREVLGEENEVQPNGKVFKKLLLGEYNWLTYDDVNRAVRSFGEGLLSVGLKPQSKVLVFGESRAEWFVVAQSCFMYSMPLVTMYATLGDDGIVHGLNESEAAVVVVSPDLLKKLTPLLSRAKSISRVVVMDVYNQKDFVIPDNLPSNISSHSMRDLMSQGDKTYETLACLVDVDRFSSFVCHVSALVIVYLIRNAFPGRVYFYWMNSKDDDMKVA